MAESEIPVIDISKPSLSVAQEVLDAACTHGFLFIKNDGSTIPQADIDEMFNLSKSFFSSPIPQKSAFAIHTPDAGGINRGWVRMSGESLDPSLPGDPKEAFNIGPPYPNLQPLPPPLSSNTDLITRFQMSCHELCRTILKLLGTALEIEDPAYLSSRHDQTLGPSGTIFRMLYYPQTSQPADKETIRAGAHSDYGSLTLLFRLPGQSGLQLQTPEGWIDVPVSPPSTTDTTPPILVNIGDLLSYWTAGFLKSTVHRVTFSGGQERYSMAYFCHPLDDARLEAVQSRVIADFGTKGKEELGRQRERLGVGNGEEGNVITAKEHLERRLKVTYGI